MTPSGIEPATFRFVAQHLKHCATAVPPYLEVLLQICLKESHDTTNSKNVTLYLSQDSKLVPFQYQAIALPVETTYAVQ